MSGCELYKELGTVNIFEIYAHRIFPRLIIVDIADTVGGQVGMAILVVWELVLSVQEAIDVTTRILAMAVQ